MHSIDLRWNNLREELLRRARRFAIIQERFIAPDGTFPPIGRSLAYRCGAFQHLAVMALRRDLPPELAPAQVRGALGAVIRRTLRPPETFDKDGWLRIGLSGNQPGIGEFYISTSSLYLATTAFLPLGLTGTDEFWAAPNREWTAQRAGSGHDLQPDHAIEVKPRRLRDSIKRRIKQKLRLA